MPLRKPRNAHGPTSPSSLSSSSPIPSSPSSRSHSHHTASSFQATAPSAFLSRGHAQDEMFDPFSSAARPRRKPYSPFSAFEARSDDDPGHGQDQDQGGQGQRKRPTSTGSVGSGYSYEAESVEQTQNVSSTGVSAKANANPAADSGNGSFAGQGGHGQGQGHAQGGKHRRSTLSFEIGGPGDETDSDHEVSAPAPVQRQHTVPVPVSHSQLQSQSRSLPPPVQRQQQAQQDRAYLSPRRPSTGDDSSASPSSHEPDSHPSSREEDSGSGSAGVESADAGVDVEEDVEAETGVEQEQEETEEEAKDLLVPPRPRFLTDASRASWSSQDSSLYPSSAPNSDTELVGGTASDSDRERERDARLGAEREAWRERENQYAPPTPRQHTYKRRSGSYSAVNNNGNMAGVGTGGRGLPPGAAPPSYSHSSSQNQTQTQTQAQTHTRPAPYPPSRRYSGGAHRRSSSSGAAQAQHAALVGAAGLVGGVGEEMLGEDIERAESPSALNAPGGIGGAAAAAAGPRARGIAPPSAFRGSRTSFSTAAAPSNVAEDAHPLSPNPSNSNTQFEDPNAPNAGEGRDAPSSVGHGSFVSASSGTAAAAAGKYAHQYPHSPSGYQYPPSPVGSPVSPQAAYMANGGIGMGPVYPGGAAYPGGTAGYPAQIPGAGYAPVAYANVVPGQGMNGQQMGVGGQGTDGYATPVPRAPGPLPHNAFMASSAMARSSMSASAVDLVPYAARFNGMNGVGAGGGYGGHSRRSSVDVGGFAPPQPPFAQGPAGAGYPPPSPGTPGTPELRHAGSLPRLREPFLSPASRRESSVWAPPTPAAYATGNLGYEGDARGGSGFFGGYAYNGVGAGSSTMLALPGKKEPLPSSALQRKISVSEKPWIKQRVKGERAAWWLTFCIMWVGVAVGAVICFFGYTNVQKIKSPLCSVLDDDFSSFNTDTWSKNVSLGGFGNGEFQMTTDSSDNLYIKNGQLYIMPTLTSDEIGSSSIFNGYSYNLTGCTETWNASDCSVASNQGTNTVVNPVKSARISTKDSVSIAYGKVEVIAKMPRGDWLWPAIWMLPKDEKYGPWPMSGEIDIVEARGNLPSYPAQGDNFVRSSLNWGPLDSVVASTFGWQTQKRSTYASGFHTYTLEWTSDFMRLSVDSKLHAMLDLSLKKQSFWERGGFPATAQNGSTQAVVSNIWEGQPNAAPFDQEFYLIIDLAVGGTSGWFPDNDGGKMWFDGSATAMTDFAKAQDTWSATWPSSDDDRALRVDSVKMWKLC